LIVVVQYRVGQKRGRERESRSYRDAREE